MVFLYAVNDLNEICFSDGDGPASSLSARHTSRGPSARDRGDDVWGPGRGWPGWRAGTGRGIVEFFLHKKNEFGRQVCVLESSSLVQQFIAVWKKTKKVESFYSEDWFPRAVGLEQGHFLLLLKEKKLLHFSSIILACVFLTLDNFDETEEPNAAFS